MSQHRPVVRLRPKSDPRRIRRGFPWVYDNELVTDRRTRGMTPGTIATLEDGDRRPLATVTVNPASKIMARVLDHDFDVEIDRSWMTKRLRRALALRDAYYDAPYYRLVHAEGDGLPGVVVDRYGDTAVIQPNAAWAEANLQLLSEVIQDVTGVSTLYKNASGRSRSLDGLDSQSEFLFGGLDKPVSVPMNGATYLADLLGGQKTGLFFDQRPNHAFVARLARGTDVLDVFSHVGGFALAALAAGATRALSIDGSAAALELARGGATASGLDDRFSTEASDAFKALEALGAEKREFGTVICDPPAFAPSKPALEPGLRAYEKIARLAAPLVEDGGTLTLCSCSHAADLTQFRTACLRGIGRAARRSQLLRTGFAGPDHPQHPQLAESGYLKALTFRLGS